MRCTGTTAAGKPCRGYAIAGGDRCRAHLRPAPDPEAVGQLVAMLRSGSYLEVAARATGLDLEDLLEHPAVVDELEAARAEGETRAVARIAAAAAESWQAAAWLLERQYPDRWGRPAVRAEGERAPAPAAVLGRLDELKARRDARRAAGP